LLSFFSQAQSVLKTMKRLPDTGCTSSYTNTPGEDSDFTINAPYFTQNGNGTVTDTITGLMWQKTDGGEMTITQALHYADTSTLAGYSDWRLPRAHEGFSILNHQVTNPAINTTVFTTTAAEYWWTSDRQANDTNKVWATNAGGGIGNHPKTETISAGGVKHFHARLVRDVEVPVLINAHFSDNLDGTITDHLTDLIWQKIPCADSLTWEQALVYADTLSLANSTDWRLPNIKELQSINEEQRFNPSINSTYFSNTGFTKYWSSTSLPNQTTKAWYLDTRFGITTYDLKTAKHYFFCVRNGNEIVLNVGNSNSKIKQTQIYPNPFSNILHINSKTNFNSYEIYSFAGKIIHSGKYLNTLDLSSIYKGIYYLKLIGDSIEYYKIIKE
jgi:hypothetical protein